MPEPVDVLEGQMTAISDTQDNLAGLIEKLARIQSELLSAEFTDFAEAVGESFANMSVAAEKLKEVHHDVELERNRIRNEE